jgi:hypothetical protein
MNDCKGHHKIEGYCDLCGEKCVVVADPTLQSKLQEAEEKAVEQGRYACDLFDETKRAQLKLEEAEAERDKAIKLHGDWTRKAIAQDQVIANQKALLDEIEEVLEQECGERCNGYHNPCWARELLNKLQ